jgi:hypothetical protein
MLAGVGQVRLTAAFAAIAATLALASPAAAAPDDPVGPGQVITDPASETEPTPDDVAVVEDTSGTVTEELADEPGTKRGELHVLGTGRKESSPVASSAPAAATQAPAPAPRASATKTLPFTGVDAGAIALIGLGLLAAGSGLLAVLRQPVQ